MVIRFPRVEIQFSRQGKALALVEMTLAREETPFPRWRIRFGGVGIRFHCIIIRLSAVEMGLPEGGRCLPCRCDCCKLCHIYKRPPYVVVTTRKSLSSGFARLAICHKKNIVAEVFGRACRVFGIPVCITDTNQSKYMSKYNNTALTRKRGILCRQHHGGLPRRCR